MMFKIINYIIDFIFPPNENEIKLRNLSTKEIYSRYSFKNNNRSSIYPYKEPFIRELVWQIKYKNNKKAVQVAGYSLYIELLKFKQPLLLIPIPISKQRRRERGYNQCELIIDEVIKLDNEGIFNKNYDLLIRTKNIDKQTHKNRKDRIANTENIFSINKNTDKNLKIIIIDDVTTTGSTLNEARLCLSNAGYNDVSTLTLAH